MKSIERNLSEQIQSLTGRSLVAINLWALQYVSAGLCESRKEALEYILDMEGTI